MTHNKKKRFFEVILLGKWLNGAHWFVIVDRRRSMGLWVIRADSLWYLYKMHRNTFFYSIIWKIIKKGKTEKESDKISTICFAHTSINHFEWYRGLGNPMWFPLHRVDFISLLRVFVHWEIRGKEIRNHETYLKNITYRPTIAWANHVLHFSSIVR